MTGITPTRSHDGKILRNRPSVVHDAEVARYNFVLQHGAGWYVDPVSVVSDDDDGALGGRGGRTVTLKPFFSWHYYQSGLKWILKADYNI